MSIDITSKKDEFELLRLLGEGDWQIKTNDDYPDLVVTMTWRQELHDWVAEHFVRWVLNGVSTGISHDNDPPWDNSGIVWKQQSDPDTLLDRYKTLAEWMEQEYTGNSRASYVSGMGLFWDTYKDEIEEEISMRTYRLLESQFSTKDDETYSDFYEAVDMVDISLRFVLLALLERLSTADVWDKYHLLVQVKIVNERRVARERLQQHQLWLQQAKTFWETHFQDVTLNRIEAKEFDALELGNRLAEVLLDTDPAIVEAIANVGLPKNFSNSVKYEIEKIAKNALED